MIVIRTRARAWLIAVACIFGHGSVSADIYVYPLVRFPAGDIEYETLDEVYQIAKAAIESIQHPTISHTLLPPQPHLPYGFINGVARVHNSDAISCSKVDGSCWKLKEVSFYTIYPCPEEKVYWDGVARDFDPVNIPGGFVCRLRLPRADLPSGTCPATQWPVYGESGMKVQNEVDYSGPGMLRYTRRWRGDNAQFATSGSAYLSTPTPEDGGCFDSYHTTNTSVPQTYPVCFPRVVTPAAEEVRLMGADGNETLFSGPSLLPPLDVNLRIARTDLPDGKATHLLQTDDDTLQHFGVNKRLARVTRSTGAWVDYVYSDAATPIEVAPGPNLLLRMTDWAGRSLHLTYHSWGGVKTLTDPTGGVIEYLYGEAPYANCPADLPEGSCRRLTGVKYADGGVRHYHYNEAAALDPALRPATNTRAFLTGITDERGLRLSEYRYDAVGRAVSTGWGGHNALLSYTANSTTVTDPLGSHRTITYQSVLGRKLPVSQSQPAGSGCAASTSSQTYDAQANATSRDDFNGLRTCYGHDLSRNLETVRVEGLQSADCASVTSDGAALPVGSRKVSTQWHPHWRLATRIAEPGRIVTRVYNGQPDPLKSGAIASCAPPSALLPNGRPIAVLCKEVEQATTDATGQLGFAALLQSGVDKRQRSWTYNVLGQVLTEDGPRTDVSDITTYAYYTDATADHLPGDLQQITGAAGQITQFTKYDRHGQLLESVRPNGTQVTHTYDLRQRLISTRIGDRTTGMEYDAAGQLKKLTQPDGSWLGYDYDDAHRQVAVYDHQGNRIAYTLDATGNRTGEQVQDPNGQLQRQLSRSIDALGRVQQTTGRE